MSKMDLSSEEKIELIYDMLERQEKRYKMALYSKWGFRIFIIIFLYIFYASILPKLDINKIIAETIAPKMSQIIAPMAEESMKSITQNMMSGQLNTTSSTPQINDDLKNIIQEENADKKAADMKAMILKKLQEK